MFQRNLKSKAEPQPGASTSNDLVQVKSEPLEDGSSTEAEEETIITPDMEDSPAQDDIKIEEVQVEEEEITQMSLTHENEDNDNEDNDDKEDDDLRDDANQCVYTEDDLVKKKKGQAGYRVVNCKVCDKKVQKHSLKRHMRRMHDNSNAKYVCQFCGKPFETAYSLAIHERIHTAIRTFQCERCDKSFTKKIGLERHMLIHTGEVRYSCDECDKSYKRMDTLIYHRKLHTGERNHACKLCGKTFITEVGLQKHRDNHAKNDAKEAGVDKTKQEEEKKIVGDSANFFSAMIVHQSGKEDCT